MISEADLFYLLRSVAAPLLEEQLGEAAEDGLHNVYLKLLAKLRDGRLEDNSERLRGYCYVAARNYVTEEIRKPRRNCQLFPSVAANQASPEASIEETLILNERIPEVLRVARRLDDPRAAPLIDLLLQGSTIREAAERLGINLNTAKMLKRRSVAALRKQLNEHAG